MHVNDGSCSSHIQHYSEVYRKKMKEWYNKELLLVGFGKTWLFNSNGFKIYKESNFGIKPLQIIKPRYGIYFLDIVFVWKITLKQLWKILVISCTWNARKLNTPCLFIWIMTLHTIWKMARLIMTLHYHQGKVIGCKKITMIVNQIF